MLSADLRTRVQQATDIVALIESHVPLKRAGRSYKALCPFHREKTPSFHVNPERQLFRCFGCGAGGTVFDFVMAAEKVGFAEALRILGDRAGIAIDRKQPAGTGGPDRAALYRVNAWAAKLFRAWLAEPGEGAERCRAYVRSRSITPESEAAFGLGYAPGGWDSLLRAAAADGVSPELLEAAGLVSTREPEVESRSDRRRRHYDRFRDRLVFPIRDAEGRVLGFGARSLDGSDPKYLNSPETILFRKSRLVYNAETLRKLDGQPILVMEGYTDVILAAQCGVPGAVATLGTALSEEHVRILARFGRSVVLVYDGDKAGQKAAERGVQVFSSQDVDLDVAVLPAGEDPCDYFIRVGPAGLDPLLASRREYLDFVTEVVTGRHDMRSVAGKTRAVGELATMLAGVSHAVKRELAIVRVANTVGFDPDILRARVAAVPRVRSRETPSGDGSGAATGVIAPLRLTTAQARAERDALAAILNHPSLLPEAAGRISAPDFTDPALRDLFERILDAAAASPDPDAASVLDALADAACRQLANGLVDTELEAPAASVKLRGTLEYLARRRALAEAEQLKAGTELSDETLSAIEARLKSVKGPFRGRPDAPAPAGGYSEKSAETGAGAGGIPGAAD